MKRVAVANKVKEKMGAVISKIDTATVAIGGIDALYSIGMRGAIFIAPAITGGVLAAVIPDEEKPVAIPVTRKKKQKDHMAEMVQAVVNGEDEIIDSVEPLEFDNQFTDDDEDPSDEFYPKTFINVCESMQENLNVMDSYVVSNNNAIAKVFVDFYKEINNAVAMVATAYQLEYIDAIYKYGKDIESLAGDWYHIKLHMKEVGSEADLASERFSENLVEILTLCNKYIGAHLEPDEDPNDMIIQVHHKAPVANE